MTPQTPAVQSGHSAAVRARARRIRRRNVVTSAGFRSASRLLLIAAYSVVFMWDGFFDWSSRTEFWLLVGAIALWLVIAALLASELIGEDHRWRYLARHLSLPLLLIAPAFLWLTWHPVVAFIVVVVAYTLELRNHSAGDGFLFSFGLVLFVGVFAALCMVEIENDVPGSAIQSPSDALYWAFGSVLKINYGRPLAPETADGRALAMIVGVCAVLGASLFTAQVVSWVVGSREEREDASANEQASRDEDIQQQLGEVQRELAALRVLLKPEDDPGPPPVGTVAS